MKCYLCNEDITMEDKDNFRIVGSETAHIDCQEKAEEEARLENGL